jgi:hypothetical protein
MGNRKKGKSAVSEQQNLTASRGCKSRNTVIAVPAATAYQLARRTVLTVIQSEASGGVHGFLLFFSIAVSDFFSTFHCRTQHE